MNYWEKALDPLVKEYSSRKHPLHYNNRYQLLVMVVLSAQTTDNLVNIIAPEFFKAFPSIHSLRGRLPEDLFPLLSKIRGFRKKAQWIIDIANTVRDDSGIPHTMSELSKLPGLGRKSSNVIIRESGDNAEGIVVDLHVVRVAPRIGVATSDKPDKIEKELMEATPRDRWNDIGMAISFHGREICRPKPECERCIIKNACDFYRNMSAARESAIS